MIGLETCHLHRPTSRDGPLLLLPARGLPARCLAAVHAGPVLAALAVLNALSAAAARRDAAAGPATLTARAAT
jgi:hypothetical protein